MNFTTREQLEAFIFQNPLRFRESLEKSQGLRDNFQQLLQHFDNTDVVALGFAMQESKMLHPTTGSKILTETVAINFADYAYENMKQLKENPFHKLTSFEDFQKKRKMQQENEDFENSKKKLDEKNKKINSFYLKQNEEVSKMQITEMTQRIQAALVAYKNISDKEIDKISENINTDLSKIPDAVKEHLFKEQMRILASSNNEEARKLEKHIQEQTQGMNHTERLAYASTYTTGGKIFNMMFENFDKLAEKIPELQALKQMKPEMFDENGNLIKSAENQEIMRHMVAKYPQETINFMVKNEKLITEIIPDAKQAFKEARDDAKMQEQQMKMMKEAFKDPKKAEEYIQAKALAAQQDDKPNQPSGSGKDGLGKNERIVYNEDGSVSRFSESQFTKMEIRTTVKPVNNKILNVENNITDNIVKNSQQAASMVAVGSQEYKTIQKAINHDDNARYSRVDTSGIEMVVNVKKLEEYAPTGNEDVVKIVSQDEMMKHQQSRQFNG